jgi:hypothetical protein
MVQFLQRTLRPLIECEAFIHVPFTMGCTRYASIPLYQSLKGGVMLTLAEWPAFYCMQLQANSIAGDVVDASRTSGSEAYYKLKELLGRWDQ